MNGFWHKGSTDRQTDRQTHVWAICRYATTLTCKFAWTTWRQQPIARHVISSSNQINAQPASLPFESMGATEWDSGTLLLSDIWWVGRKMQFWDQLTRTGQAHTDDDDKKLRNMFLTVAPPPCSSHHLNREKRGPSAELRAHSGTHDGLLSGLFHRDLDVDSVCHHSHRSVSRILFVCVCFLQICTVSQTKGNNFPVSFSYLLL